MPTEPEWSDAWLLVALVYGKGEPSETLGAADALNHALPTPSEWAHAAAVLGERGLVEAVPGLVRATPLGRDIVDRTSARKGVGLFRVSEFVLREIVKAPVVAEPLDGPS